MAVSIKDFKHYIKVTKKLAKSDEEEDTSDESEDDNYKAKTGRQLRESEKKEEREAKKLEKRKQMKEELAELQKIIRRNMVGSVAFFNHNSTYFTLGILSMMFEAVSFNSLSSIPGMFVVIGLLSLYEIK